MDNVKNKADVLSSTGIAAGFLIGGEEKSLVIFKNCANEGSIYGVVASGFAVPGQFRTIIVNSINNGSIYGVLGAFGLSSNVIGADNVVQLGSVQCYSDPDQAYNFWNISLGIFPSVFCSDKVCQDGSDGDYLLVKETNSHFYVDERKDYLVNILNSNKRVKQYGLFWADDLSFSDNNQTI